MTGAYAGFVQNPLGKKLAAQLGLPRPVRLRRYAADAPLVDAPVLVGGLGEAPVAARVRSLLSAEGVETAEQLSHLQRELCSEFQGFLYSQAIPAEEVSQLLRARNEQDIRIGNSGQSAVEEADSR